LTFTVVGRGVHESELTRITAKLADGR